MSEQLHDICVMLKTGANINMRVKTGQVHRQKLTGEIAGFEFTECATNYPLFIDLKQVAAIVQRLPGPTPYSCAGCAREDDPSCCCHGGKGYTPALDRTTGSAPAHAEEAPGPADPDGAEANDDEGQG